MHYTSWDRTDRDKPVLLAEDGPEKLARFEKTQAHVGDEIWKISADPKLGVSLSLPDGREFNAHGRLGKDENINVVLDGHTFTLVGETSKDWVIVDAQDEKVGQFTGAKRGVRKAIVEFDGEHTPTRDEAIALSYFARLILESKIEKTGYAMIGTLVLLSIVAVLVFFS